MMTPFYAVANNASTTTTGYSAGSGTLALAAGTGVLFGTPTAANPILVTTASLDRSVVFGIYACTGRTGDTLTGLTLLAGTDATLTAGCAVEGRWTAEHVAQITGAIATLEAVAYNVLSFGAAGDGVTDDTAAIQAALAAAAGQGALVFPKGAYRVTRNLYLYGKLDLIGHGDATLELDADLALADGNDYWINAGIQSKAGPTNTWTGRISGLNFSLTATGKCLRMLNVHRGLDWRIERCQFDVTAAGATGNTGAIGCYNNAAWCASPTRQHGRIVANRFLAAQSAATGSEGIGVGNASHLWIEDNFVSGFGDDPIGLHTCTDFLVARNRCYAPDGRIYLSGPLRGRVQDNYCERTVNTDATWIGGGGLLNVEIESSSQPAPKDLIITGNRLVHGAGTPSATYGLRLRGVRNTLAQGNSVHDDSGFGIGLTIEGLVAPTGWTDADGLDTDGKARIRNLRVIGNQFTGNTPPPLSENQPFTGSTAGPLMVAANTPTTSSSTFTVSEDFQVNGNLKLRDGTWNGGHWTAGNNHAWIDASGNWRTKLGSAPTSDTDGLTGLKLNASGIASLANPSGNGELQLAAGSAGSGIIAWNTNPSGAGGSAKDIFWQYCNWRDPHVYLRDMVNARMHATYTPGTSSATATTEFGSVVSADGGFVGDGANLTNLNGAAIATGTIAAARLGLMSGDAGTGGAAGAVPAPGAGAAAAGKFLRADATWAVPAGSATAATVLYAQTADKTVSNTTTVTSLVGTGSGSNTLGANVATVGKTIRVRAYGSFNSIASPGTINFQLYLGSTRVAVTSAVTLPGGQTGRYWDAEFTLTFRATGTTGSVYASGKAFVSTTASQATSPAATTIDTTAALAIDLRCGFSVADPGNAIVGSLLEIVADN